MKDLILNVNVNSKRQLFACCSAFSVNFLVIPLIISYHCDTKSGWCIYLRWSHVMLITWSALTAAVSLIRQHIASFFVKKTWFTGYWGLALSVSSLPGFL
jgi:hypothetical protein